MAYTVLARKYRSQTLEDVVGQGPIATTLANAIRLGRIHHGYLFTGTRGVGKTSVARILAKCLNCLAFDAPTVTPCCKCQACQAIAEGQDIDVVEIDAASNTGVDNIRELRSNTAYRPARSRFKVYIIDEVHMLSTGAFNALLKTLEEPPEHVKFILATTEVQKVPATIQSRCQRFNFRNIRPEDIAARLAFVARSEGAEIDEAVVRRVARLANGSMRDALSILDQLLAVSPKKLSPDVLDAVLPPPQDEQLLALLSRAADGDVAGALRQADEILSGGRSLELFCTDAIELARALMLLRACGPQTDIVDFPAGNRAAYVELAGRFELSQYVQMIGLLEELRRNVRSSSAGRALADAVVVRLARMRQWAPIETLLAQLGEHGPTDEKKKPGRPVAPQPDGVAEHAPPARVAAPRSLPAQVIEPPPRARPAPAPRPPAAAPVAVALAAAEPTDWSPPAEHATPQTPTAPDDRPPLSAGADVAEACAQTGPAANDTQPCGEPRPARSASVTAEQRACVESDPLVQRVLELFEGTIVNIERRA